MSARGLAGALRRKAETGGPGAMQGRAIAEGEGWRALDIVCTAGPQDRPFEETQACPSVSIVLSGSFTYRGERGHSLLSAGSWLLVSADRAFECSHEHGEGDRCLSVQFAPALFERLARDVRARSTRFAHDRLPPVPALAALSARAAAALGGHGGFEEIALELGAAALGANGRSAPPVSSTDIARVAPLLREIERDVSVSRPLANLAGMAGLSPYHFLRVFKAVAGVTPHQWLLRTRLRRAAHLLVSTRMPVTEIALEAGFDDLSNFIRTFRAEFGASPRQYRTGNAAAPGVSEPNRVQPR